MNIMFNSDTDVVQFLFDTQDWLDWEVIKLQLSTPSGVSLAFNTKINDPLGIRDYQPLRKLRSMIKTFMNENEGGDIIFDVKLRLPRSLISTYDPTLNFSDFFIDFFSSGSLSMVSTSQVEKISKPPLAPIVAWETFVTSRSVAWKELHNYNKNV